MEENFELTEILNHTRDNDLEVNVIKAKKLINMHSAEQM